MLFQNVSLRACVPDFKVQGRHFLQKLELLKEVTHVNFYKTYTAKTPLTFLEECLCSMWLKHKIVTEDCYNVIFIATCIGKVALTKKWDVNDWKMKASTNLT